MPHSKICVLPWIHLALFPGGHVLHCCQRSEGFYIDELGSHNLNDVFNHDKLKQIRSDFFNGKIPEACRSCFALEDQGGISWRMHVNQRFENKLKQVKTKGLPLEVPLEDLCYLDLRFSNVCNSSCRICGPHYSTGWNQDATFLGQNHVQRLLKTYKSSPQFKEELYRQAEHLEEIYFSGGDPLLHEEHNDLLKYLVECKRTQIKLCYNTNLPIISDEHLSLWREFPRVVLSVSLDAKEKQGEYIRKGQNWEELWHRIQFIKKEVPHVDVSFSLTLSLYNAYAFIDLLRFLISQKISPDAISLNILSTPNFLSVRNLPSQMKVQLSQLYHSFENEFNGAFKPLIASAFAELNREGELQMIATFKKYNERLDLFRNEKFLDHFPEYVDL